MIKLFFSRHSMVSRLIWGTLLSLVTLSLLIGYWGRVAIIEDALEKGVAQQTVLNRRAVIQLDRELAQRKDKLQQLAAQLVAPDGSLKARNRIQQLMDTRIWLKEAFSGGLILIGADGVIQQDSPHLQGRVGLNLADRDHFQWVKNKTSPVISRPLTGRVAQEPMYIISVPVLDPAGNFIGALAGVTLLKGDTALKQVVDNFLPENGHIYVIDLDDELIVTSSRRDLVTAPLKELAYSEVIPSLQQGRMEGVAKSQFGGDVMYSTSYMLETGWVVVNTYSVKHWLNSSEQLISDIIWLTLGCVLLIILITIPYVRRQLLPIQRISADLENMSQPDVQPYPIEIRSNDEISDLATAFNQLLAQLKEKERSLSRARKLADEANSSKTQFLANVSHEIKTPLNAVMSLAYIQLEQTFDYDGRLRLQKIQRSGRELLALVNDIFSFIELENNSVTLSRNDFHLEEALSDLLSEYADLAAEKEIELVFNLKDDVPLELVGDSRHLFQVLNNLLSNALKFTETGYVGVEVACFSGSSEPAENSVPLEFAVYDTGQGISPENLHKLFSAFKQLDESNSRNFGGIGMGLAISNKLVHLLGGDDIRVQSRVGKGSRFSFVVPMQPATERQTGEQQLLPLPDQDRFRALVIDDQPISRSLLADMLKSWSVEVQTAANLQEGLTCIGQAAQQQRAFNMVFLDWTLPGRGPSTLERLEQMGESEQQHCQLFILTSGSEFENGELENGRHRILSKPLSRSQVFNAVNQALYDARRKRTGRKTAVRNARVLVVDDNQVNREVVAALLARYSIPHDLAVNGQEAISYVQQQHYDLVLMDLQMPVMDGYEATRRIRAFNEVLPVVALTAAALDQDRKQAQEAGMDAFLTKPIDQTLFYEQLGRYIELSDAPVLSKKQPLMHRNELPVEKGRQQRILIVDDEVANLKILAHNLNKHYVVQLASNGPRALELCGSGQKPDLILLDIQMPDMDGYEVCRQLKSNPATSPIPVIFVTALSEPESEERGLSLGAVDYIAKPYQMSVVQARVRTHINLKQKTDLLEELSYLDGLTHIANRRHFDIMLDNELNRLQRGHLSLGLIMLDIDYFKPFNDNYGHGKGDECLQQVAKALDKVIERPSDLLARYGGEEFVVVLPETDAEGVLAVAERLRQAVNHQQLTHEYSAVADHVTISLGCIAQRVRRATRAEELLKKADDALYQAKKQGRNCVVLAEHQPEMA